MKLKVITSFLVLFILFSIFAMYQGARTTLEIKNLQRQLNEAEHNRDRFYGQLRELSSIMLEINSDTPKDKLLNSIRNFRQNMYSEFKADSFPVLEIPNYQSKNQNIFHGYHDELIFAFENDKLVDISYGDFKPKYKRIN
jgi:hypothetical protein